MSLSVQCLVSPSGWSRRDEGIILLCLAYDSSARNDELSLVRALERRALELGKGPIALIESGGIGARDVAGEDVGDCGAILVEGLDSIARELEQRPGPMRELARGAQPFDPDQFHHGDWNLLSLVQTCVTGEQPLGSRRWTADSTSSDCIAFAVYAKALAHEEALREILAVLHACGHEIAPQEDRQLPRDILTAFCSGRL